MFSHCPKCTATTVTTSNRHRYFCETCKFEYFHNTASAVAAFVVWEDKLLLTRRARAPGKGQLDLPGGFVDHDESLEQALTRELEEELALTLHDWRYFCSQPNTYEYNGVTYKTCDCAFETTLSALPVMTVAEDEISELIWVSPNDIQLDDIAFPSIRTLVAMWITKQQST